ncbi:MAG: glycosyltransferase 4 family protein [Candidatus Micrarchaeota archaeon]
MIYYLIFGFFSLIVAFLMTKFLIPRLVRAGLTGNDVNKLDKPLVAEMGGLAIVGGLSAGMLLAIFFNSFFALDFNLIYILAALLTVYIISLIGICDDLLDMPQWLKAILPLFAAIPLVAVSAAGSTEIFIPFFGSLDVGIFYILVLIPIGIAVASNLTNMLAGFNGMEASMGAVIFAAASLISINNGSTEMAIISISMFGALLGFLFFNRYPSRVFPGDVGNLSIGAVLASSVIIGNFETAGAILVVPYVVDFFIKMKNKFPSSNWWGENREAKLYPVDGQVRGFAQLIMKKANGISEKNLVLAFVAIELVFAVIAVLLYM